MGELQAGGSLNLQTTDLTPEQLKEQLEITKSELEKVKLAKNESYAESQKLNRVIKVSKDAKEFVKLYESDKKMAQRVVDYNNEKYDESFSVRDYLDQIGADDKEEPKKSKKDSEEELLSKFEAKLEEKEAKKVYKEFLKKKEIDETSDFGKDVIELYEDLMEGKRKTPERVEKYLKMALREAKRTSEFSESYKKAIDDVQGLGSPKRADTEPQRKSFVAKKASIFEYVDQRKKA